MNPRIILTSLLVLSAAGTALAQTGEISGRVLDQGGAAVPGAKVAITQTSTGTQRTIETNAEASTLPNCSPGRTQLRSSTPAFGRYGVPISNCRWTRTYGSISICNWVR